MRLDCGGAIRRSLVLCAALVSVSIVKAGPCTPDLATYTPTPTIHWK